MVNPSDFMKVMNAQNKFTANHPKVAAFLRAVLAGGIPEGTVIEISLTRPGEETMTTNLKVQQSDLELLHELQTLGR